MGTCGSQVLNARIRILGGRDNVHEEDFVYVFGTNAHDHGSNVIPQNATLSALTYSER